MPKRRSQAAMLLALAGIFLVALYAWGFNVLSKNTITASLDPLLSADLYLDGRWIPVPLAGKSRDTLPHENSAKIKYLRVRLVGKAVDRDNYEASGRAQATGGWSKSLKLRLVGIYPPPDAPILVFEFEPELVLEPDVYVFNITLKAPGGVLDGYSFAFCLPVGVNDSCPELPQYNVTITMQYSSVLIPSWVFGLTGAVLLASGIFLGTFWRRRLT